ncbi:MAG: hypothetical protein R3C10_08790 [Pirellulales bacterium]
MDPLRLAIALGPLGVYLLALGCVHLLRRPIVVEGSRDTAALALALSGFVAVGPIELFMPVQATLRFGTFAWLLMFSFYALLVFWVILSERPRLVIYNTSLDELRPVLSTLINRLDATHRWAGRSVTIPQLRLELYVSPSPLTRTVTVRSLAGVVDPQAWRLFYLAVRDAAAAGKAVDDSSPRRLTAIAGLLLIAGTLVTITAAAQWLREPAQLAQQFYEMFRL